jgi:hypothetical protein
VTELIELLPKADGIVIAHPDLVSEFRRSIFAEIAAALRRYGTKIFTPDGAVSPD